jgi:hypothetical protein
MKPCNDKNRLSLAVLLKTAHRRSRTAWLVELEYIRPCDFESGREKFFSHL